jgi:hypothetical protein
MGITTPFLVRLDRDSVCAGDDTDPHDIRVAIPPSSTIGELLDVVARQHYLAGISGGQATWLIAVGGAAGQSIGVMAQQWEAPRLILPGDTPLAVLFADREPALYFRYGEQADPELVFDRVKSERDLPERRNSPPA